MEEKTSAKVKALEEYKSHTEFDGCDYVGEVAKEKAFFDGIEWTIKKFEEFSRGDLIETKDRDGYPAVESRSCRTVSEFINSFKKSIE